MRGVGLCRPLLHLPRNPAEPEPMLYTQPAQRGTEPAGSVLGVAKVWPPRNSWADHQRRAVEVRSLGVGCSFADPLALLRGADRPFRKELLPAHGRPAWNSYVLAQFPFALQRSSSSQPHEFNGRLCPGLRHKFSGVALFWDFGMSGRGLAGGQSRTADLLKAALVTRSQTCRLGRSAEIRHTKCRDFSAHGFRDEPAEKARPGSLLSS